MKTLELTATLGKAYASMIAAVAQTALLNPDQDKRAQSICNLDRLFDGRLNCGYVGDNQLFLELEALDGSIAQVYVCDLPKELRSQRNITQYNFRMPER